MSTNGEKRIKTGSQTSFIIRLYIHSRGATDSTSIPRLRDRKWSLTPHQSIELTNYLDGKTTSTYAADKRAGKVSFLQMTVKQIQAESERTWNVEWKSSTPPPPLQKNEILQSCSVSQWKQPSAGVKLSHLNILVSPSSSWSPDGRLSFWKPAIFIYVYVPTRHRAKLWHDWTWDNHKSERVKRRDVSRVIDSWWQGCKCLLTLSVDTRSSHFLCILSITTPCRSNTEPALRRQGRVMSYCCGKYCPSKVPSRKNKDAATAIVSWHTVRAFPVHIEPSWPPAGQTLCLQGVQEATRRSKHDSTLWICCFVKRLSTWRYQNTLPLQNQKTWNGKKLHFGLKC